MFDKVSLKESVNRSWCFFESVGCFQGVCLKGGGLESAEYGVCVCVCVSRVGSKKKKDVQMSGFGGWVFKTGSVTTGFCLWVWKCDCVFGSAVGVLWVLCSHTCFWSGRLKGGGEKGGVFKGDVFTWVFRSVGL